METPAAAVSQTTRGCARTMGLQPAARWLAGVGVTWVKGNSTGSPGTFPCSSFGELLLLRLGHRT